MSPPSDSDILVFPTESDNTQDSTTKIIELKKETESLSSDSSDPVNEEKISVEDQEEIAVSKVELGGNKQDRPSLSPTMDTVLSEESTEAPEIDFRTKRLSVDTERKLEADVNNVANYIDIKKVVGKNESNYYYTPKNRSTRETIAKIKKKKKGRSEEVDNLDTSQHAKLNILDGCSGRSSYFGPTPALQDGSPIVGILKNRAYFLRMNRRRDSLQSERSENSTRSVELKSVHIREHERIAGDNPCVSSGVPLSIGWGHVQHDPIPLDAYESAKGPPRDKIEMMVPASVRKSMLRDEFKVSVADLNASMKIVNITKKQRRHTVASEHLEGWQEVSESAKRKFKRLVNKTSTKKEEAALWEQAHTAATQSFLKTFGSDALAAQDSELLGATEMPKEISFQAEE